MLIFLKKKSNKIWKKIEKLMKINFERKLPFSNNITYTAKTKTPIEGIIYKFSSIVILHSVRTKDNKQYPEAYLEECKYERVGHVFYFDNILILLLIVIVILRNNLFITYK